VLKSQGIGGLIGAVCALWDGIDLLTKWHIRSARPEEAGFVRILISAVAIASVAGALQAGDWTGAYGGVQAGQRSSEAGIDGGRSEYGLHGGYDIDYGGLVLGGELEVVRMQLVQSGGGAGIDTVGRLKFRAGHDFGQAMGYAILGGAHGDAASGRETGVVYGLGLLATVGDHLTLGGEALRQVFDNFAGSGSDVETDSFNVRVSFRF